ncbi:MAG: TVP38/TMEM64 family protein [Parvularculaceae bacterium]
MTDNEQAAPPKKGIAGRLIPLVVIVAALGAFFYFDLDRYFSIDALRDNRETLDAWVQGSPVLAVGAFVIAYAAAVAISFPGATILTIFGGFLFGVKVGAPAVITAATLGATIVFLAAKSALGDTIASRAQGFVKRMEQGFREDELNYMFLLRLAPIFPFWAVNLGAGVLGVSLRNFFIGTFLGIMPGSIVYTGIGNAARSAIESGDEVNLSGALLQPSVLLPIVGLAALAVLPILLKRLNPKAAKALDDADGSETA